MICLKLFIEAQQYYFIYTDAWIKGRKSMSRYDGNHTDRKKIIYVYAMKGSLSNHEQLIFYTESYRALQDLI